MWNIRRAPMFYAVSTFHRMTVSLALDGDGLSTMWGGEQNVREPLAAAGFRDVQVKQVEGKMTNIDEICGNA